MVSFIHLILCYTEELFSASAEVLWAATVNKIEMFHIKPICLH